MKITMLAEITGLRDGRPWPSRFDSIEVPEDEAEVLIANGLAKKYEKADAAAAEPAEVQGASTAPETTVAPPPETAVSPAASRPAKKAAAKRARAKK